MFPGNLILEYNPSDEARGDRRLHAPSRALRLFQAFSSTN